MTNMTTKTVYLNLDEIILNSDGMSNCREVLEDIPELAEDIAENGLLNDLGVWQPPGKDYYVLNYGYRRHAAMALLATEQPEAFAELGKIPCKVFGGDLNAALMRNLAENIKRKTVNRADLIKRVFYLHERVEADGSKSGDGNTQVEIAKAIGKTQSDVSAMMGIALGCVPEVIKALRGGHITYADSKKLSAMTKEEQIEHLMLLLDDETAAKAKKLMAKATGTDRPGLKVMRDTAANVQNFKADTDVEFRAGVVMGIRFALGLESHESLYTPPKAVGTNFVQEKTAKRQVRTQRPKKQFTPKPQEQGTDDKA